ncbi:MAG: ADP-ribosylation factor-like protein [Candidatus Hodarchaeales archaeon]|jgi:Ras-related GTP-binding protein A/B
MSIPPAVKLLLMGLYQSGKSTIRSVVFEGKDPKEFKSGEYSATINYHRDIKKYVGSDFQVFDCGGQEAYIEDFVGKKAEFIFSNVKALVWVVDVNNVENVSVSKFYFDKAVKSLIKFSPDAVVYCLLHKVDLVIPNLVDQILESVKEYFKAPEDLEINYFSTSIFNQSVFTVFGNVMKIMLSQSRKVKNIKEAIQEYLVQTEELVGITIYTDDGLPVFEEGEMIDKIIVPANLWLSSSERLKTEFQTKQILKSTVETDEYVFVFQKIKDDLLLTGVAKRKTGGEHQFIMLKMDQLADYVNELM